jgi:hypothetical protein
MAEGNELVDANLIVRFSKDNDAAGLFIEGKQQPLSALPVVGPVDNARRARIGRMYIELAAECVGGDVQRTEMVTVDEDNRIVREDKR